MKYDMEEKAINNFVSSTLCTVQHEFHPLTIHFLVLCCIVSCIDSLIYLSIHIFLYLFSVL